jgi:hypothetical protein
MAAGLFELADPETDLKLTFHRTVVQFMASTKGRQVFNDVSDQAGSFTVLQEKDFCNEAITR